MIRFSTLETLGVSVAAFSGKAEGDCGLGNTESHETRVAARDRVCMSCGVNPGHLVCARQVHGVTVARVEDRDRGRGVHKPEAAFPETDGLLTNVPGLPLAVFVADCAPVYLVDPKRRAIGVVHAGRRGTRDHICRTAVLSLHKEFGSSPADLHAVIGPCIGGSVYEVSADIAEDWRRHGLPAIYRFLDLAQGNVDQLVHAGVPPSHITVSRICTLSDPRFYSYRSGDKTARNMALLML